jgi:D-serine deaminase-like pyridoxal phosphate-dependent protein
MTLDEVDTPALVIDLDAFERNLRRLADRVAGSGVNMRPHAKTHKCPVIALKQNARLHRCAMASDRLRNGGSASGSAPI